jgi:transcriptional regulator with XRE-family HTH domain
MPQSAATSSAARSPVELDRALGDAIRLRRRDLNLSQHELAQACGISFQQIQKYEYGENRVSFSRLVQIAHALECRVADLTSALDQADPAAADLHHLRLLTIGGATTLLNEYAQLSPESRRLLIDLLSSLRGR